MRYVLIIFCAGLLVATAWYAVMRGLAEPFAYGAPQIEEKVDSAVRTAIAEVSGGEVTVDTDGRHVTLAGPVQSAEDRDRVLAAASDVPLLGRLTDAMEILPRATPFTFEASKTADGALTLGGHVPSRTAEEALLDAARAISSGTPVKAQLRLAAGAPEEDWNGMASTGMQALSRLVSGRFTLSDREAHLEGKVDSKDAADAILELVTSAPDGEWTTAIEGIAPLADPYIFRTLKTADGALVLEGHAPDDAQAQTLVAAVQALSDEPLTGGLEIARGMPGPDWPDLVKRGLGVLDRAESGLLEVSGNTVSLNVEVDTLEDEAALASVLDPTWASQITVLNPPPSSDITLILVEGGALSASGRLPEALKPDDLTAALPDLVPGAFATDEPGLPVDWVPALEGLNIVLPRFQTAKVRLLDKTMTVTGKLKRGFSAQGSAAALRSVLGRDWALDLDISESAPLAEVILSKRGPEIALSGVLPMGLEPGAAIGIFGPEAGGEGLTGGGEGESDAWRQTLTSTSKAMRFFSDATGRVANGKLELDGTLLPGYGANPVQEWLGARLPDGWTAGLSAQETAPSEDDARISLTTGETELFRRGFWLPQVSFPVSGNRCKEEADRVLSTEKIQFVTGSARIDQKGRALLNRLSAVAIRCLNSSTLRLSIGGHTDSVGNDEANQKLSEERAQAVAQALAKRGVRVDAMTATGYGEGRPVASNDVPEGRAKNRRITFEWMDAAQ